MISEDMLHVCFTEGQQQRGSWSRNIDKPEALLIGINSHVAVIQQEANWQNTENVWTLNIDLLWLSFLLLFFLVFLFVIQFTNNVFYDRIHNCYCVSTILVHVNVFSKIILIINLQISRKKLDGGLDISIEYSIQIAISSSPPLYKNMQSSCFPSHFGSFLIRSLMTSTEIRINEVWLYIIWCRSLDILAAV